MHYAIRVALHAFNQIGRRRTIDVDITVLETYGFGDLVNLDRLAGRQRGREVIQRCCAGIRAAALCGFVGDDGVAFTRRDFADNTACLAVGAYFARAPADLLFQFNFNHDCSLFEKCTLILWARLPRKRKNAARRDRLLHDNRQL